MSILRSPDRLLVVFGIVCSTWIALSRASTKRSFWRPLGDVMLKGVAASNVMVSRRWGAAGKWLIKSTSPCNTHVFMHDMYILKLQDDSPRHGDSC